MSRIAVKPELIRWAIERSGLPVEELYNAFPKLSDWESGDRQPTFRQLEKFARKTMAPLGYLLLDHPPEEKLPVPDFRTHGDQTLKTFSPNLIDTIHVMQRRQEWMREWLIHEGAVELPFVGSLTTSRSVKSSAQEIRQILDLDPDWAEAMPNWETALTFFRKVVERSGVLVFSNSVVGLNNHRPLNPNEFRGFVLSDAFAPTVFLNDADSKSARIFTLAHEMVHVCLGQDGLFNLENLFPAESEIEQFCNQVAGEFLIPEYKIREHWNQAAKTRRPHKTMSELFKVSPLVAARRALDLQLISQEDFFKFYHQDQKEWQQIKQQRKASSGGGNFYSTQESRLGRRFSSAVVHAAYEGHLLFQEAFRLTNMSGKTFHAFAEKIQEKVRNERE